MPRYLIATVFVVLLVCADVANSQSNTNLIRENYTEDNLLPSQFIPVKMTPSQPPRSALSHRLFPENNKLFDRNGAIYYHRAIYFLDTTEARLYAQDDDPDTTFGFSHHYLNGELTPELLQRIQTWLKIHEYTWQEAGFAVHSSHCDWQLIPEEVRDSWQFLHLSEIQSCRGLARLFAVKARYEIAQGNMEEAIKAIQYCNKMAADVHQSELIVGSLVGNSCAGMTYQPIIELMQAPDSPSLYWPLATLTEKVIDVRPSIRSHLSRLRTGDGLFENPEEQKSLIEWRAEANKYFDRLVLTTAMNRGGDIPPEITICSYPIAKQLLLNNGMAPEEVDAIPSIQLVAMVRSRIANWILDEYEKGLRLDNLECLMYFAQLERRIAEHPFNTAHTSEHSLTPYLDISLPPIQQLLQSSSYLQRKRCAMQVLEAIRLHLGATGELPKSLDEITIVTVPLNPETGKPFRYEFKDNTAKLFDFGLRKATATVYEITTAEK